MADTSHMPSFLGFPNIQHGGDDVDLLGDSFGAAAGHNGLARSQNGTNSRSSTSHASRHQAAEQRRRTRINERLDILRQMVPHTERSNTAVFLEELINYINLLKIRLTELEGSVQAIKTGRTVPAAHVVMNQDQFLGAPGGISKGASGSGTMYATDPKPLSREHLSQMLQQAAVPEGGLQLSMDGGSSSGGGGGSCPVQQLQQLQMQQQRQQLQQLQMQQQVQQMQMQMHHDAVLSAAREKQAQQQQQLTLVAGRHSTQPSSLADLAGKLGLKTVMLDGSPCIGGGSGDGPKWIEPSSLNSMYDAHCGYRLNNTGQTTTWPAPTNSNEPLNLQPSMHSLSVPPRPAPMDASLSLLAAAASHAHTEGHRAALGTSPANSSDFSGVPPKKRKVL